MMRNILRCNFEAAGLLLALLSCFFFSWHSVLVKVTQIHPLVLTMFRMFFQGLYVVPTIIYRDETFFGNPEDRKFLWARAVLGATGISLIYYAYHNMAIGDASVIIFAAPVFTSITACVFLREKCGIFETVCVFLTFAGVVLIACPPWLFEGVAPGGQTKRDILAPIAAFGAMVIISIVYVILRKFRHIHYSTILFTYSLWGVLQSGVLVFILDVWSIPNCLLGNISIVAIGALANLGQICMTKALQLESAGGVGIVRTMDIVFVYIWQWLVLDESPRLISTLGASVVILAVIATGIKKVVINLEKARIQQSKTLRLAAKIVSA
ncbi:solute carrier family 35 member G1-like [Lineus longissimus]|uniref:solute carrier family 35 member G1-like n=1 Tax=Lineus longissimus TaxID=88925 RepID=UPI00315CD537